MTAGKIPNELATTEERPNVKSVFIGARPLSYALRKRRQKMK